MKTILYATDYSKNSVAALKYAHKMATQLAMRLVVCHVFDNPTILGTKELSEPFPHLEEDAFKTHRHLLEQFCDEHLGANWKQPNLQIQPAENTSVFKGIISVADEWHAYLIIVGTKGKSEIRKFFMGSTTKQLIEKAPCPVLAIPEDTDHKPITTLAYASDFEEEDIYAIRKLAEMAKGFDAEIRVVHIATKDEHPGEKQMELFRNLLKDKVAYDKVTFELLFSENIFECLRSYLKKVNADLIVMLERDKPSIFKKWFRKDLVKKMESYGKIPLMSFRAGNHQLFHFSAVL